MLQVTISWSQPQIFGFVEVIYSIKFPIRVVSIITDVDGWNVIVKYASFYSITSE